MRNPDGVMGVSGSSASETVCGLMKVSWCAFWRQTRTMMIVGYMPCHIQCITGVRFRAEKVADQWDVGTWRRRERTEIGTMTAAKTRKPLSMPVNKNASIKSYIIQCIPKET